jgi:hypothetical protein
VSCETSASVHHLKVWDHFTLKVALTRFSYRLSILRGYRRWWSYTLIVMEQGSSPTASAEVYSLAIRLTKSTRKNITALLFLIKIYEQTADKSYAARRKSSQWLGLEDSIKKCLRNLGEISKTKSVGTDEKADLQKTLKALTLISVLRALISRKLGGTAPFNPQAIQPIAVQ